MAVTPDGIAIVPVIGTLVARSGYLGAASGLTAYSDIAESIEAAATDPGIRAILLDVDSSGGEVGGLFDLVDHIQAIRPEVLRRTVLDQLAERSDAADVVAAAPTAAPKRGGFGHGSASALRTGQGLATVVMFILVPQVNLKKRLDVDAAAEQWADVLPGMIVGNWRE